MESIKAKGMDLVLDEKAKDFLIEAGYNPDFGARPLRRAISSHIEDALAEGLLGGVYASGHNIMVTHLEGTKELTFETEDLPAPEAEASQESETVESGESSGD